MTADTLRRKLRVAIKEATEAYSAHVQAYGRYGPECDTCNQHIGYIAGLKRALHIAGGRVLEEDMRVPA